MKREVQIGGKKRVVEIERRDEGWAFRVDGKTVEAEVAEISSGVYSILLGGRSFEARVAPQDGRLTVEVGPVRMTAEVIDPRRRRREHGEAEREGVQQIAAPMPGKVVRLLIEQGSPVEVGQGILVLEAMKMQNEVRSPKSGMVERLLVKEGQTVNAGDTLAVIA
jgi:biotin carboxyl carrier protein